MLGPEGDTSLENCLSLPDPYTEGFTDMFPLIHEPPEMVAKFSSVLDVGFDLSGEWTGRPGILQSTGLQRVRHD